MAVLDQEQITWREGHHALIESHISALSERLVLLKDALAASIASTDSKAQTANNELERLLDANMHAIANLAGQRFESTATAIIKVEQQLILARDAANDALRAVDERSSLRHTSTQEVCRASTDMLLLKVGALQNMVDLRSEMNQVAISKAEQANERRFDSVNEFRQTLTDQATTFVTRSTIDARLEQADAANDTALEKSRQNTDLLFTFRTELTARIASLEGKLYVGGAGIIIIITVLQLALNFYHH